MKDLMKNKLLITLVLLLIFGISLILPIGKVSASTEWNLQITNLAGTTTNYSYDQLLVMPVTNVSASLLCYGKIVTYGIWSGVSLSYLLQQAGADPTVASIDFLAQDGYTASIPLQIASLLNVIIAYEKNGLPLSEVLRLVLPDENGAVWVAMITSIKMDATIINLNQYLSSTAPGLDQIPQMKSAGPSGEQQQKTIQTQPTATMAPKNETKTAPTTSSTNITVPPNQNSNVQQSSSPKGLAFPAIAVYGIAVGGIIASAAASFMIYDRRRIKQGKMED
jgi:DMSO/TMAO reductase YedYZ molybdopterin-dependent catalytic subunit